VKIDNVFGSITSNGSQTAEARLEARKSLRADSQDDLLRAEREVKLNMVEKDNQLDIYVDGPFRCRDGPTDGSDRDYVVTCDFKLEVPELTNLILKTVNDGDILVQKRQGRFHHSQCQWPYRTAGHLGAVHCQTVNGRIRAAFRENPVANCAFTTVNGDLDVRFHPICVDFQLKTFNGEIFTDFPVSYLPAKAGTEKREKGHYVYRSHSFQGMRVGNGGPEIKMETLNGDIVIAGKSN